MKRIILLSGFLCFGMTSAQVPQGTQFISGQIGFSNTKDHSKNSSMESYKFLPTYGYFFARNWAVVLSAGYKQDIDKSQSQNATLDVFSLENKTSAFVVTPSLRKFWVLDSKFSLFCQLDFPLEFGNVKHTTISNNGVGDAQSKNSYSSFGVSIKPGIDYFLSPRWKIAASIGEIGYFNTNYKESDASKNRFNMEANLANIQLGVKYIIPAKNKAD